MDYKLDSTIGGGTARYFFTLLGPRFDSMNDLMAASLERRFGYPYRPIYIVSARPNRYFAHENYIVLNKHGDALNRTGRKAVVSLQEYEDLNLEFMTSPFIRRLAKRLTAKQGKIPVYAFTSSFFDAHDPRWLVLGPSPRIAKTYDDKTKQYELFRKLNLPRNHARVMKSKNELLRAKVSFPCYVSASYSSGGNESSLIKNRESLMLFLGGLRSVNTKSRFLVSEVFENLVMAPNVNALVTGVNKTNILVITDQILRGNRYLGNSYPSLIGEKHREMIRRITVKIGNYLSRSGYRGLFGCDFLIDKKGKLVVVDLNPRRQGGYGCNGLALHSVGVSITDHELACALGESSGTVLDYEEIQYPAAWAHTKVKPHEFLYSIREEIKEGDMKDVFLNRRGVYRGVFYPKSATMVNGYFGYVVVVGKTPRGVRRRAMKIAEDTLR